LLQMMKDNLEQQHKSNGKGLNNSQPPPPNLRTTLLQPITSSHPSSTYPTLYPAS
ncbi:hypothetical protein A2U01_0091719, partial [Trifolium medium]|nr:hypothetical protein [Trifolium medium]